MSAPRTHDLGWRGDTASQALDAPGAVDDVDGLAQRVVITGMGVVSPLGDADGLWASLLRGDCAVRDWPDLRAGGYRGTHAARIAPHDADPGHVQAPSGLSSEALARLNADPLRRGRALALLAAERAVAHSGQPLPAQAGVYVGSTLGESLAFERAAEGADLDLSAYGVASFTQALHERWAPEGPQQSLATACAAGNYAVGAALDDLRAGRVDVALAGGVEPFSRLSLVGFSRSRAMASEGCRPFDAQRSGMLLGEGAAMFVLERADRALARGAQPLAEVCALGLSCDAHHPTAPLPDGSGMRRAMQAALDQAGVAPQSVSWVNAHGTGTRASDAAEARALRELFGERLPLVSGSKGAVGHALGASSALELAVCVQGLRAQTVPPTVGHAQPDDEAGVSCTREPVQQGLRWVLNNAFAFGGLNSSLLLKAWDVRASSPTPSTVMAQPVTTTDWPVPDLDISLPADMLEREAIMLACEALSPLMKAVAGNTTGLYLASCNAGTATALRFWVEAQRTGVALANPELFPWCLANAPCAALARQFGITGPNATWLGGPEAVQAAHQAANAALTQGVAPLQQACVVAADFGSAAHGPGRLRAWRLARH